VGLIIYPSEDFDFVNLVELPDLILDLFCIHSKYTDYGGYGYNILSQSLLSILFLVLGHPALELSLARLMLNLAAIS
jgi:hypothetical protein